MLDKRTLTTGEIAKYCGVNFRTVIRWIERGDLKSFKLPGRGDNRVAVEEFIRFLNDNEIPIPDEFRDNSNRVLIIEDEKPMAQAIERTLIRAKFETQIAHDGFAAGVLFSSFSPAVATLDLQMPGMGGFEVLEFVKSQEQLSGTRILIVSAMPMADLQRAMEAGADDYLEKPFQNEELIAKVARLAGT